ncbi:MAG: acyl-[ACP]--phospholipid O-acyltransferase [Hyphomicrobiaceae bacterium]|nr:acyl-[ACP]--phospholipid O-acyltransferase [Hyphomicrobiaceae bacterium]
MFKTLMTARRFAPLFWCQLLSALNDNFLKTALGLILLYKIGSEQGAALVTLGTAIFMAPFFLLSALGGELADKFDKGMMAERIKLAELLVAVVAAVGFGWSSVPIMFVALALYGVIGALFGPIKYGILPDHLSTEELTAGNALVEGGTFIAILAGAVAAGWVVAESQAGWTVSVVAVSLALACWVTARFIPQTGAAAPGIVLTRNPLASTLRLLAELRSDRRLWIGGHIVSWFWLVGAVAMSLLPTLIKDRLGGTEGVVTLALAAFTIGIAIGSATAARASHHRPNLALVPIGAFLMAVFAGKLAFLVWAAPAPAASIGPAELLSGLSGWPLIIGLAGLAFAGGLFIVPSFAAVQSWAAPDRRARSVAAVNILNAAYMTGSGLAVALLQAQGVGLDVLFLGLALGNLLVMGLVLHAWGREGVRDLGRFIFQVFLRLEVKGLENLPKPGERTIIAPNHVSLLDGPIMHTVLPGHAAFAIDTGMAEQPWVKPFLKVINFHTLDPTKPLATRALVHLVQDGRTIVIFPEGRLTVTGGLMKVYDGTAMIADKADAWIVPVRIEGPERSGFSYMRPTQILKTWFPKTTVTILPARKLDLAPELKGKARRQAAGAKLQDIMVDTAVETARIDQTLFAALVAAKRTRATGKSPAVEDPLGSRLSYGKLILGAQVLGEKLAELGSREGEAVGVLLPNTSGVAVTFFALQSIGRVAAMLNYTAGPQNVVSACRAAEVRMVLTSQSFVEKGRLEPIVQRLVEAGITIHYLEDVRTGIGLADKLRAVLRGSRPLAHPDPNTPAVVLFTSGSEGTPKGVVLSHRNLLANAAQCLTRVAADGEDKVFNVLPVFHSFGLTGGMIMPLVGGIPVYLYPSPLHYRIVPELVYQTNATILFGTDTFLAGYARTAHPYDFHNVRLIMAGAEAVKERTRQVYMERFGVRILEGYGVTETAPVLAMNTPLANRPGTVGRLSPLMKAELVSMPGIEEGGKLLVSGPNVMLGYYRAEKPGVLEPPAGGWHDTGDIVSIDGDGYIRIKGRAKRFAKVGGEMVSLAAVETMAAELWPQALSVVVSVPDPRKGERLVMVTQQPDADRAGFLKHARLRGATELSVPAEFMVVPRIPLLGSGKPDYQATTALVKERLVARETAVVDAAE